MYTNKLTVCCARHCPEEAGVRILLDPVFSSFLPQIIVVFICFICNICNVNFCCKNIWFSGIAVFTMSYHSRVICAFEINNWFIITIIIMTNACLTYLRIFLGVFHAPGRDKMNEVKLYTFLLATQALFAY